MQNVGIEYGDIAESFQSDVIYEGFSKDTVDKLAIDNNIIEHYNDLYLKGFNVKDDNGKHVVKTVNNTDFINKKPNVSWWKTVPKSTHFSDMQTYYKLPNTGKEHVGQDKNKGKVLLHSSKQTKLSIILL